jgi:hypothetical protein
VFVYFFDKYSFEFNNKLFFISLTSTFQSSNKDLIHFALLDKTNLSFFHISSKISLASQKVVLSRTITCLVILLLLIESENPKNVIDTLLFLNSVLSIFFNFPKSFKFVFIFSILFFLISLMFFTLFLTSFLCSFFSFLDSFKFNLSLFCLSFFNSFALLFLSLLHFFSKSSESQFVKILVTSFLFVELFISRE